MKNLITTLMLFFGICASINAQAIYVCNQSNSADYNSLQDAINQASDGDSIYVNMSHESYGEISITKKVILIAKKIFTHDSNHASAKIDKIILEKITDDNSDASHSVIQGFEINYLMTIADPGNYVQNVTLTSNQLNYRPKTHSTETWKISNNRKD
ncbi:hypothetical protein [Flammeovirga aprica]|uniref:DUF1565 domain-containing protein n=1 Tax=Flammeovirga aprica JL-4 TaxID=694437 RepID=A0A7X9XDC4_9BACT|nr:hypothetical protein [Flammeovirga aprica]NME72702.1 hypothetical protein [Flammeovirga aprica JL-4]